MTDKDLSKPLPEQPEPIVNPEYEPATPKTTEGNEPEDGEGDDTGTGDHPTKKPDNP